MLGQRPGQGNDSFLPTSAQRQLPARGTDLSAAWPANEAAHAAARTRRWNASTRGREGGRKRLPANVLCGIRFTCAGKPVSSAASRAASASVSLTPFQSTYSMK